MSLSGFQRRRRELAAQQAAQAAKEAEEQAAPTIKPFAEMTKKELIAYANEKKIDLGTAKTNAEIIEAIEKG